MRFYGKLSAAFGPQVELTIEPPCTVAQVRRELIATHPDLAGMMSDKRVRPIVGDSIVPDAHELLPADELEFLAPVSGG